MHQRMILAKILIICGYAQIHIRIYMNDDDDDALMMDFAKKAPFKKL